MRYQLILILLLPLSIRAQESTTILKEDSSIKVNIVRNGRYPSVLYTFRNEVLTNSTMKSVLNTYPKSAEELKKYYGQRRTALVMLPIFIASTIVGVIQADNKKDISGSAFSKAPIPFSVSVGAIVSSIIMVATNNHFHKAIDTYNRQLRESIK